MELDKSQKHYDHNNNESEDNETHSVCLRMMPTWASDHVISRFFAGLPISEIKIITDKDGLATGSGLVKFETSLAKIQALKQNNTLMGLKCIQVLPTSDETNNLYCGTSTQDDSSSRTGCKRDHSNTLSDERYPRKSSFLASNHDCVCVEICGISSTATRESIEMIFNGVKFVEGSFFYNADTGRAYAEFMNAQDYQTALSKANKGLDGKRITVYQITKEMMVEEVEKNKRLMDENRSEEFRKEKKQSQQYEAERNKKLQEWHLKQHMQEEERLHKFKRRKMAMEEFRRKLEEQDLDEKRMHKEEEIERKNNAEANMEGTGSLNPISVLDNGVTPHENSIQEMGGDVNYVNMVIGDEVKTWNVQNNNTIYSPSTISASIYQPLNSGKAIFSTACANQTFSTSAITVPCVTKTTDSTPHAVTGVPTPLIPPFRCRGSISLPRSKATAPVAEIRPFTRPVAMPNRAPIPTIITRFRTPPATPFPLSTENIPPATPFAMSGPNIPPAAHIRMLRPKTTQANSIHMSKSNVPLTVCMSIPKTTPANSIHMSRLNIPPTVRMSRPKTTPAAPIRMLRPKTTPDNFIHMSRLNIPPTVRMLRPKTTPADPVRMLRPETAAPVRMPSPKTTPAAPVRMLRPKTTPAAPVRMPRPKTTPAAPISMSRSKTTLTAPVRMSRLNIPPTVRMSKSKIPPGRPIRMSKANSTPTSIIIIDDDPPVDPVSTTMGLIEEHPSPDTEDPQLLYVCIEDTHLDITKSEIREFLSDLSITDDDIHFVRTKLADRCGCVFIKFATVKGAADVGKIGKSKIGEQEVLVKHVTAKVMDEMDCVDAKRNLAQLLVPPRQIGPVVKITRSTTGKKLLPATKNRIMTKKMTCIKMTEVPKLELLSLHIEEVLEGINIMPHGVYIMRDINGNCRGNVFVELEEPEDCANAVQLSGSVEINGEKIRVFPLSPGELDKALEERRARSVITTSNVALSQSTVIPTTSRRARSRNAPRSIARAGARLPVILPRRPQHPSDHPRNQARRFPGANAFLRPRFPWEGRMVGRPWLQDEEPNVYAQYYEYGHQSRSPTISEEYPYLYPQFNEPNFHIPAFAGPRFQRPGVTEQNAFGYPNFHEDDMGGTQLFQQRNPSYPTDYSMLY